MTDLEQAYWDGTLPCVYCGKRLERDGWCENCQENGDDYDERYQED